jgi:hypothetical protein
LNLKVNPTEAEALTTVAVQVIAKKRFEWRFIPLRNFAPGGNSIPRQSCGSGGFSAASSMGFARSAGQVTR